MPTLAGRRVVITRRAGQSSALAELLEERGATVVEVPAIEIAAPAATALDAALRSLERYQWVVFTSANAVHAVEGRIAALGSPRSLTRLGPKLASVGAATTAALRSAFPADPVALEPTGGFRAAALAEAFSGEEMADARVLLPCSSRARDELPRALRALGAEVDVVVAYETVEPADLRQKVSRCLDEGFDLVAFASPSAVLAFASAAGARARGLPAVVIGPTTAAAAQAEGFAVKAVADPATAEGLVRAAEEALAPGAPGAVS